jgi:hypothetical protein
MHRALRQEKVGGEHEVNHPLAGDNPADGVPACAELGAGRRRLPATAVSAPLGRKSFCWPGGPGPAPSAGGFGLTGCELEVLGLLRQPGHRQQAVYLAQDGQGARAEHPGRARRSEAAAKVHVLRLLDPVH